MPKFIKLTSYGVSIWVNVLRIQAIHYGLGTSSTVVFSGMENDSSSFDESPEQILEMIRKEK